MTRIGLWIVFHLLMATAIWFGLLQGDKGVANVVRFLVTMVMVACCFFRDEKLVTWLIDGVLRPAIPMPLMAVSSIAIALLLAWAGEFVAAAMWLIATRYAALPIDVEDDNQPAPAADEPVNPSK